MQKKKSLVPIPFIFSFLVILGVSFYANSLISFSMRTMEYNIEHRLIAESKRLANMVSAEELDKYRAVHDMELPEYHALRQRLLDFSLEADILYAYYYRPQKNGMQYIVDNDFNEETRVGVATPPFDPNLTPWILQTQEKRQAVCSGLGHYTRGWEGLLSGYAPIFDRDGNITAIAGVDIHDEPIVQARRLVSILTVVQIIAAAAVFVSGIIYLIYLYRQVEIAREANAAKSWFLSRMSHEIRTPLNAVIGLSEIELQGCQAVRLPDSTMDNIARIHQSGSSLLGMINDILDISKIEANRFELAPAVYETAPLLSDTINLNMVRCASKGSAGGKPITLKLEIDGGFPAKLRGDELRIRQILNNLLSNAIKYTQEGTVTLNVLCETIPDDAANVLVRFTVRDTGIGIRAEDMGKLFTSYTQLDTGSNRKIEGTGLGLTITKRLVEMMGGSISVESEYGKGSVFTAQIVQGVENADDVLGEENANFLRNFRHAPERKEKQLTRLWLPSCKALVVDDISFNLHVARGLLALYRLQIDTAASGQEAIEKAQSKQYDIIFMDHMMPEMDGIETADAIRKIDGYANTPIIALTANAMRGMRELYLERGFQSYLSKPISMNALDEVIREHLEGRDERVPENDVNNALLFSMEFEEKRLDKLNHYRAAFDMLGTAAGENSPLGGQEGSTAVPEFDAVYYRRFIILLESFDALPDSLKADKALLVEAGRRHDAQKIRETLPVFCENVAALRQKNLNDAETKNKILGEILQRLKKALQEGDVNTSGKVITELGAANLSPVECKLYFKLYDLLMDDNAEEAIGVIDNFSV
jgi:signal transduction histidine kinase/CheY-like chemotaxis protein